MSEDRYQQQEAEDKQVLRAMEIRAIEQELEMATPEERKLVMIAGDRSFTLEEMLAEVKEGTEYGEMYLEMRQRSRIERLRRK